MAETLVSGVPVDAFVAAVYGFELQELRLDEWTFALDPDLLQVYRESVPEAAHYRPFMNLMMQLLLDYVNNMKRLDPNSDVNFPCGFYFDAINGGEKIYGSDERHERRPDGSLTANVGHMGYQRLREKQAKVNPDDPDFKLHWDYIMAWFEFKFSDIYMRKHGIAAQPLEVWDYPASEPLPKVAPKPEATEKRRKPLKGTRSADSDPDGPNSTKRVKSGLAGIPEKSHGILSEPLYHGKALDYSQGKPADERKKDITLVEVQAADYAAESLRTGRRRYSTGVFVRDGKVSLWYYDRMGPICSREFDPVAHPELFLLVTVALARANLQRLGFEPLIVAGTNTFPSPMPDHHELRGKLDPLGEQMRFVDLQELYEPPSGYEVPLLEWKNSLLRLTCELDGLDIPASDSGNLLTPGGNRPPSSAESRQSTTIDFPITDSPLYVQPGAIGRGTVVLPIACPNDIASLQARDGLVAKMSWQPVNLMAEDETVRIIRRKLPKAWMKHVTDLKCSTTLNGDALNLPRKVLMSIMKTHVNAVAALRKPKRRRHLEDDSENFLEMADAFIGQDYEERVLRILVTSRYLPLCEVKDLTEFKTVFTDVVKVHYIIYTKCGILHRDLSVNNIMFTRRDGRIIGILNDWDLAASTTSEGKTTFNQRMGTASYMSIQLLKSANSDTPQAHEYQHDLESFCWILIWCAFVLRFDGKQVEWAKQYPEIKEWTTATTWTTIADSKRAFFYACQRHLPFVTSEMQSLSDTWLREVCYGMWCTFISRETPPAPRSFRLKNPNYVQMDYNFFTFEEVMRALEPELEKPEEDVFNYVSAS